MHYGEQTRRVSGSSAFATERVETKDFILSIEHKPNSSSSLWCSFESFIASNLFMENVM